MTQSKLGGLAIGGVLFLIAAAVWSASTAGQRVAGPLRVSIAALAPVDPSSPTIELRWGRAEITHDPAHFSIPRSDWNDTPDYWDLRPVNTVPEIPREVQAELQRLDCTIPVWRQASTHLPIVWGEFERRGQRDMAVLCAHSDRTSSTYVFWGGEAARRETMPQSGSAISLVRRAGIEAELDLTKPIDPDMPGAIDHDGLDIGCCEAGSTIFYRYRGRWFTLPGGD
jgi:hypothetical protein